MKVNYPAFIAQMVRQTQNESLDIIARMPSESTTEGQVELQKKHGTPKEFAEACIDAIGEISPLEAYNAILKYRDEWDAAK